MTDTPPSFDDLNRALLSDEPSKRFAAIEALRLRGDAEAIALLGQVASDASDSTAWFAASALWSIGDQQTETALIALLHHPNKQIGLIAVHALAALKSEQAIEPLAQLLRGETDLRVAVLDALVNIGPPAVPSQMESLSHSNPRARRDAAEILGRIGDRRAFDPLMQTLGDPVLKVRGQAAYALAGIGDVRAVEPIIALLQDEAISVRKLAAKSLGRLKDNRAVDPLIQVLGDRDEDVRCEAIVALGRIHDTRAVPPLIAFLSDPSEKVVNHAVTSLGFLGDPGAIDALLPLLRDPRWNIREKAATAFGRIGAPALLPLVNAAHDATGDGLWHTGSAIARITDPSTTTTHIQLLHHEIDRVGYAAYEALRKIGTPEALAAIDQWERDRRTGGG